MLLDYFWQLLTPSVKIMLNHRWDFNTALKTNGTDSKHTVLKWEKTVDTLQPNPFVAIFESIANFFWTLSKNTGNISLLFR